MPISSNGSELKVTTVFGDKTYDNEDPEFRRKIYDQNQQGKEIQRHGYKMQPPPNAAVRKPQEPTTAPVTNAPTNDDKALKKANKSDLKKRNLN